MNEFSRILSDAVERGEGVGFSARITHKGRDLFRGAAGYADKERKIPFTCDNLIRIFSMTKLITGVAAMMLFEKGYFTLDEPVHKYLPAFQDLKVITYDSFGRLHLQPAKNTLTIRHIFTMTAGFAYQVLTAPYDPPRSFLDARAMAEDILRKAAATPNLTSEKMLEAIASIPLAFEPGTGFLYGPCSDIVGGLIEAITKKTFGEFLQEELFAPLGMKDTCFRPDQEQLARLAVLYDYSDPKNVVPYDANAFNIAHRPDSTNEHFIGALYSTLDDFSTFMQMMVNGGAHQGRRLIGENALQLMTSDHLTHQQFEVLKKTCWPAGHATWGLLCRVTKSWNHSQPFLAPGSFGWGGWAGTQAAADPAKGLTITMMVQRVPADSYGVLSRLMQTAYSMI